MPDLPRVDADRYAEGVAKYREVYGPDLPLAEHSAEFERIHAQLQQALTNLDGV